MTNARIHAFRPHGARSRTAARMVVACRVTAWWAASFGGLGMVEAAAPNPSVPSRIVDPAVVPAGAMGCTSCGTACGGRGGLHGHHGHHSGCRDGQCVPYCPVRPDRYGFYGTQWRRWPGQQILQVSNNQEATPVAPPRSAVPDADEESMSPQADDLPAPTPQAATPLTAPAPDLIPSRPEPQPAPEPRQPEPPAPAAAAPEPAPAPVPEPALEAAPAPVPQLKPQPVKPEPAPTPAQPRAEDENLFEADSGWKAKRKFAAARRDTEVKPVGHAAGNTQRLVPRVPFDAAAETRQVRAAGGR